MTRYLSTSMGQIVPLMDQAGYRPTRYLSLADGPVGIGEFSKDLAFALYPSRAVRCCWRASSAR